ncbi:zinc-binding alcohol dehydrogenase family protein [Burkholderia contaminans]|nr:zinc-binding alcohol dehydrogenase family protein [Burkholderia contaminans]
MKAAVVTGAGERPVHMEFDAPSAMPGHSLIDVTASALSRIAQARASGTHYSSDARYPFVVGVDGVGRLDDGRRVYFFGAPAPFGAMAERTIAPDTQCVPLPDGLDDVTAAAIAIPGMSSWAALTERARLVAGETVLVNGATGASGRLAVRIAKHLGAAKVIATGRNSAALQDLLNAGADAVVSLQQDDAHLARALEPHFREGVDVVLDYLWGASAQALLVAAAKATPDGRRLRFVQIGSIGGADVLLPGAVLRATAIELMGSGIGSVSLQRLLASVRGVFDAAGPAGLAIDTHIVPLSAVGEHWGDVNSLVRPVFTLRGGA